MRFHNFQILRIVAAVGVVLAHLGMYAGRMFEAPELGHLLAGSWVCLLVPIFFAISGFVLTQAVQSTPPGRFLFARALRLYPGFWLATILFSVVIAITGWPDPLPLKTRLANIGWTLRPGEYGTRLFVLGVEWTLIFEIVLYVWLVGVSRFGPRGPLFAAALWLVLIAVKLAVWPGYAMNSPASPLPTWGTVLLSAVNTPFFLGVLTYYVRERGYRFRWPVFACVIAYLAIVPGQFRTLESLWCVYLVAAAALVWFAVQIPQVSGQSRLVSLGDWTYGVYLIHTPLMMGTFAALATLSGWVGSHMGVFVAGSVALSGGLLFGWLECRLHLALRPLLRLRVPHLKVTLPPFLRWRVHS
jgi:exopolysaccharide production protein ExoZ